MKSDFNRDCNDQTIRMAAADVFERWRPIGRVQLSSFVIDPSGDCQQRFEEVMASIAAEQRRDQLSIGDRMNKFA